MGKLRTLSRRRDPQKRPGVIISNDTLEKLYDGWLGIGDVGTLNEKGFIQITDRSKDVLKSCGEWVSSFWRIE